MFADDNAMLEHDKNICLLHLHIIDYLQVVDQTQSVVQDIELKINNINISRGKALMFVGKIINEKWYGEIASITCRNISKRVTTMFWIKKTC